MLISKLRHSTSAMTVPSCKNIFEDHSFQVVPSSSCHLLSPANRTALQMVCFWRRDILFYWWILITVYIWKCAYTQCFCVFPFWTVCQSGPMADLSYVSVQSRQTSQEHGEYNWSLLSHWSGEIAYFGAVYIRGDCVVVASFMLIGVSPNKPNNNYKATMVLQLLQWGVP